MISKRKHPASYQSLMSTEKTKQECGFFVFPVVVPQRDKKLSHRASQDEGVPHIRVTVERPVLSQEIFHDVSEYEKPPKEGECKYVQIQSVLLRQQIMKEASFGKGCCIDNYYLHFVCISSKCLSIHPEIIKQTKQTKLRFSLAQQRNYFDLKLIYNAFFDILQKKFNTFINQFKMYNDFINIDAS